MKNKQNLNSFHRQLLIIFCALMLGMILFALVIAIVVKPGEVTNPESFTTMGVLVGAVVAGGLGGGYFLMQRMLQTIKKGQSTEEKMEIYRRASIVRFASHEAAVLISLSASIITGGSIFLYIGLILIGFFIILIPSKDKLVQAMHLTPQESNSIS